MAWLVFRFLKFGGLRGAMFGSGVQQTVGEVTGSGGSFASRVLKVHVLNDPPERAIGLEIVAKTFASYQMMPITLSLSEARNLLRLLQVATGGA
jgi:hypothetical protein